MERGRSGMGDRHEPRGCPARPLRHHVQRPLNTPKLPGVPSIESFKGHTFHTSRWDYAYTGGSAEGGLSELMDKRVAIIGTGATAVQCIPHLGASAKALYVFQRTPSSIDVRNNRPTDPPRKPSARLAEGTDGELQRPDPPAASSSRIW